MNGIKCPNCGVINPVGAKFCMECGAPLVASTFLPSDYEFNSNPVIQIKNMIHYGDFTVVYEAYHKRLEVPVIVRELFPRGSLRSSTQDYRVMFPRILSSEQVNEMKVMLKQTSRFLASVSHPNIVKVFDVFEENNTVYVVMEYLKGPTLEELVTKQGPLSEEAFRKLLRDLISAITTIHKSGYVHANISPKNVIYREDSDTFVLLDVGLPKIPELMQEDDPYIAPELYSSNYDELTDVYLLSATLYYAITGSDPSNVHDEASKKSMPSWLTSKAVNLILSGLSLDLAKRPSGIATFKEILKDTNFKPLSNKTEDVMIFALVDSNKVCTVNTLSLSPESLPSETTVMRLNEVEGVYVPILNKSGRYVVLRFKHPNGRFTVRVLETTNWKQVAHFEYTDAKGIFHPTFSYNEHYLVLRIGYLDHSARVDIISTTSWKMVGSIYYDNVRDIGLPTFSPDESRVVIRVWRSSGDSIYFSLLKLDNSNALSELKKFNHSNVYKLLSPIFSPDGKYLLLRLLYKDYTFSTILINAISGEFIDLYQHHNIRSALFPVFIPSSSYVATLLGEKNSTFNLEVLDPSTAKIITTISFKKVKYARQPILTLNGTRLIVTTTHYDDTFAISLIDTNTWRLLKSSIKYYNVKHVTPFIIGTSYLVVGILFKDDTSVFSIIRTSGAGEVARFKYESVKEILPPELTVDEKYIVIKVKHKDENYEVSVIEVGTWRYAKAYKGVKEPYAPKITPNQAYMLLELENRDGTHSLRLLNIETKDIAREYKGKSIAFNILRTEPREYEEDDTETILLPENETS